MKKIFLSLLIILFVSSCGIQNHISFNATHVPTNPEDTIAIEAKFWGLSDLVQNNVPANSKTAVFFTEVDKHCDVTITQSPKDFNDTLAIKVSCDSNATQLKKLFTKKTK